MNECKFNLPLCPLCCNPSKSSHAAQIFSPDYYRPHRWRSWSWLPKEKVRAEARRRGELKGQFDPSFLFSAPLRLRAIFLFGCGHAALGNPGRV